MYRAIVFSLLLLMVLLPQQSSFSKDISHDEKISEEYKVILDIPNPPLRVGRNVYYIQLFNSTTLQSINTSSMIVKLSEQQPSPHNGWNESHWIKAPTEVRRTKPGFYVVKTTFPHAGSWYLEVLPNDNPKRKKSYAIYFLVKVQSSSSS
jgi:hypothetical protein